MKEMGSFEKEIQSGFINEQVKAQLNVLYTANYVYNKISANLKPFGVTHEQFNVLRILRGRHPGHMSQKDILQRMIAPNSNITLIIKRLVKKGFVHVAQSARDRREYEITITKQGQSKLKELDKYIQEKKDSFNKLTVSEAFHLNALLDKLRS